MRYYRNRSGCLLLLLLALAWADAEATKATFLWPVVVDTTAVDWSTGEARIRVVLMPSPKSQTATLRIVPNGRIVIHHSLESALDFTTREADTQLFTVNFPPRDTVGLRVFRETDNDSVFDDLYFVTTDSQPKLFLHCDPRHLSLPIPKMPPIAQPRKDMQPVVPPSADTTVAQGHLLNPSQEESRTSGSSAVSTANGPMTREQMEQLEEQPLTEYSRQEIVVDGVWFGRDSGDYRFKRVQAITDWREWDEKVHDSLANMPPSAEFRVNLFVPDSTRLAFVRSHVAKLIPAGNPDTTHYYDAEASLATIREFDKMGIRVGFHALKPIDRSDGPRKKRPDPNQLNYVPRQVPSGDLAATSSTAIFSEGFEGVWPGVWAAADFMPDLSGWDTWAPVSCRAHYGCSSVLCDGADRRREKI